MKIIFILFILAYINPDSVTPGISFIFSCDTGVRITYKINIPVKIHIRSKAKPPFCIRYLKAKITVKVQIVNTIYIDGLVFPDAAAIYSAKLCKCILRHTEIKTAPNVSFFQCIPGTIIKIERMAEGLIKIWFSEINIQSVRIYRHGLQLFQCRSLG